MLIKYEVIGVFFIFILGTLFHFIYQWSGQSKLVALIAPINESVWEHLKLVLWPSLLYALFEYIILKPDASIFWAAKTFSIYTAAISIIVIFYLYTSVLGRNYLILDILTFLASVVISQIISCRILMLNSLPSILQKLSPLMLAAMVLVFFIFTFFPPHLPVFKNPMDGKYGL